MEALKRIMPKKDGLYAITLNHLGYIVPGDEQCYKEDNNMDNLLTGEEIGDVYTLVTYKGNGLFEEHYSGEKAIMSVRIYDTEEAPTSGLFANFSDDNILTFNNEQQKNAKFDFFKKTPLTIDPQDLMQITPEIISKINASNIGDSVRAYIDSVKKYVEKEFAEYEMSEKQAPKTM